MTSENAWKERWTGKLPPFGGEGRGRKKYLLHSKISHNNGSSHQIMAGVRMDKHLPCSSLAVLTKIWYPVRETTDHSGLFWRMCTLVFFTLKRTYQYFIASISLVPGSQFMCFCDFELFLSWVYQQTAAPEQKCLHVGSKWQFAAQSFHFLLIVRESRLTICPQALPHVCASDLALYSTNALFWHWFVDTKGWLGKRYFHQKLPSVRMKFNCGWNSFLKNILNITFCRAFKHCINVRLMWNHFMQL